MGIKLNSMDKLEQPKKMHGLLGVTFALLIPIAGCTGEKYTISENSYTIKDRNYTFAIYNNENQLMTHPLEDLAHEVSRRKALQDLAHEVSQRKAEPEKIIPPITDIYVISHGWNYAGSEAVANYHGIMEMLDCVMQVSAPNDGTKECVPDPGVLKNSFPSFQPYFIFVTWTSTTRPVTEAAQAILPFGFDKAVRSMTFLVDAVPVHLLTGWKQSLNASQNALGSDPFPSLYFFNDRIKSTYGTESFYYKDASIGRNEPVSSLVYKLIQAKGISSKHPCKEEQQITLDIPGVKLHLVGHSYGAKLVAFSSMEALRRFVLVDNLGSLPSPYTDWGEACLRKVYNSYLPDIAMSPEENFEKLSDREFDENYKIQTDFGEGFSIVPPNESRARAEVERIYGSLQLDNDDSLIESLVFINPAMHPDEFQYSNGYLGTKSSSVLAMIPRKAILYSKYDYPNGILFSARDLILNTKSAQLFNLNQRFDVPILSQSLGVVSAALSMAYSIVHGAIKTTISTIGNLPRDLWYHIKTHRFLGHKPPIDTQGFEAGWLGFWNFLDYFAPIFPPFTSRDEDDQGLFRLSRPGLGKTGLKRIAAGRFTGLNLGGLAQFYEDSEDIDAHTFCNFTYLINNDNSEIDHETTRRRFYSFNASQVYNTSLVPIVGSHGDLRSTSEVSCSESSTAMKQKREHTFNFIFNFTKTNFVKGLEKVRATQ